MRYQLYPHIIADPDILSGKPVIEGTRVPASTLIEQVAAGKSFDEVARENGVRVEDVRAALEFGAQRVAEEVQVDGAVSTHSQPTQAESAGGEESVTQQQAPMSELGKRLAEIRARIVASGTPLLTWDEIDAEVAERRGEHGQGAEE